MDTLLIGFALGLLGGVLGDILRERLRRIWDRRVLAAELRDDLQLMGELFTNIVDQAKELGGQLGGQVGPAFSNHAKRDLELARDRFGRLMDRLHLLDSFLARRRLREFHHVLHSTAFALAAVDERDEYGLDIPGEAERTLMQAQWQKARKGAAERCVEWLEHLRSEVPALLQSIPEA